MGWDNLLSGLIGAAIGGAASVFGGLKAVNISIIAQKEVQKEKEKYEKELEIKKQYRSAKIIENDICTAVSEAIRVVNEKSSPGWGSTPSSLAFDDNYHNHLSNISEILSLENIIRLNKLNGLLKIYQESTYRNTIGSSDIRTHLIHIGTEIFGEQFKVIANNFNHEHFTKRIMMEHMVPEHRRLFNELSKITGEE